MLLTAGSWTPDRILPHEQTSRPDRSTAEGETFLFAASRAHTVLILKDWASGVKACLILQGRLNRSRVLQALDELGDLFGPLPYLLHHANTLN